MLRRSCDNSLKEDGQHGELREAGGKMHDCRMIGSKRLSIGQLWVEQRVDDWIDLWADGWGPVEEEKRHYIALGALRSRVRVLWRGRL